MTHQAPFVMHVADVFHLADGRTVFVGEVLSSPPRIQGMRCQLVIDGEVRDHINLEGEMRFSPNQTTHRAISANKPIPVSSEEIRKSRSTLRSDPPTQEVFVETADLAGLA